MPKVAVVCRQSSAAVPVFNQGLDRNLCISKGTASRSLK